jgi:hypothetical protein
MVANNSMSSSVKSHASMLSSSTSSMRSSGGTYYENSEINSRIRLSHAESVPNIKVEKLTMNKLRFASLGLHGRTKEIEALRGCFERFVNNLAKRQSSASEGTVSAASPKQKLAQSTVPARGSNLVRSLIVAPSAISSEVMDFRQRATQESADSPKQTLARKGSSKRIAELFPDLYDVSTNEVVFISGESGTGKVSWIGWSRRCDSKRC